MQRSKPGARNSHHPQQQHPQRSMCRASRRIFKGGISRRQSRTFPRKTLAIGTFETKVVKFPCPAFECTSRWLSSIILQLCPLLFARLLRLDTSFPIPIPTALETDVLSPVRPTLSVVAVHRCTPQSRCRTATTRKFQELCKYERVVHSQPGLPSLRPDFFTSSEMEDV